MNRRPVIRQIPDFPGRTIVISDLHANDHLFTALLEKCQYSPGEDRLILLGDLVEKGSENLQLLHHIMELSKRPEVYALMGNCDFVAKNVLFSYRSEFLRSVLLERKASLIHEMAAACHIPPLDEKTDMDVYTRTLRQNFLDELCFLNDLPHALITPAIIYAHSGIDNEKTIASDFRYVMTRFRFEEEPKAFVHTLVVGHMPVSEYCDRIADFRPRFDGLKNIISIDGGNSVKKAGQLNALLIEQTPEGPIYSTEYVDDLDKVRVLGTTSPSNPDPFYLTWHDGEVEILEARPGVSLVYSPHLNRTFEIDNVFLSQGNGSNYTNYEMPLSEGETVSLVNVYGNKAQIKKNGCHGWTYAENLELTDEQLARPVDLR